MKRILIFLTATLPILLLCSCSKASQPPETTQPPMTEVTFPPETVLSTVSDPSDTMPPETAPKRNTDSDLLAVLSGSIPVQTESGISLPLEDNFSENHSAKLI